MKNEADKDVQKILKIIKFKNMLELTKEQKFTKLNEILTSHIDGMVIKDIESIMKHNNDKNFRFTYPYILLVSAGVDFFGGLEQEFKDNNSGFRSKWFMKTWMKEINPLYEVLAELLYGSGRCTISHRAMFDKIFESNSYAYPSTKHLYAMNNVAGKDKIFLHAIQFAKDFIKAQKKYRDEYMQDNPDMAYNNLMSILTSGLKPDVQTEFEEKLNYLKEEGYYFDLKSELDKSPVVESYDEKSMKYLDIGVTTTGEPSSTTSISSKINPSPISDDQKITRLYDDSDSQAMPSVEPEEDEH